MNREGHPAAAFLPHLAEPREGTSERGIGGHRSGYGQNRSPLRGIASPEERPGRGSGCRTFSRVIDRVHRSLFFVTGECWELQDALTHERMQVGHYTRRKEGGIDIFLEV